MYGIGIVIAVVLLLYIEYLDIKKYINKDNVACCETRPRRCIFA